MFTEERGKKLSELVLSVGDGDILDVSRVRPMPLPDRKCGSETISAVGMVEDHIDIPNLGPGTSHSKMIEEIKTSFIY
jgi:hypothetical protein